METAVFQFTVRNLSQKRGQPRVQSPAWFTAPPTLLLLLFQGLGTGSTLRFISRTAAPAQCAAKSAEDTENLCTDLSDLRIKCTEISPLCASRETPEEYSSLLKIKEKLQICIFSLVFFFFPKPQSMSLIIFTA